MKSTLKVNKAYNITAYNKWQTALNELRLENIKLKNKLSDAIKHDVNLDFVESAERFQQNFIEKDMVIDLLRHDMNTFIHGQPVPETDNLDECQYKIMERDIEQLIIEFRQMRNAFLKFLGGKTS